MRSGDIVFRHRSLPSARRLCRAIWRRKHRAAPALGAQTAGRPASPNGNLPARAGTRAINASVSANLAGGGESRHRPAQAPRGRAVSGQVRQLAEGLGLRATSRQRPRHRKPEAVPPPGRETARVTSHGPADTRPLPGPRPGTLLLRACRGAETKRSRACRADRRHHTRLSGIARSGWGTFRPEIYPRAPDHFQASWSSSSKSVSGEAGCPT